MDTIGFRIKASDALLAVGESVVVATELLLGISAAVLWAISEQLQYFGTRLRYYRKEEGPPENLNQPEIISRIRSAVRIVKGSDQFPEPSGTEAEEPEKREEPDWEKEVQKAL